MPDRMSLPALRRYGWLKSMLTLVSRTMANIQCAPNYMSKMDFKIAQSWDDLNSC